MQDDLIDWQEVDWKVFDDDQSSVLSTSLRPFREHLRWSLAVTQNLKSQSLLPELPAPIDAGPGAIEQQGRPRLEDMPLYDRWLEIAEGPNHLPFSRRKAAAKLDEIRQRWADAADQWDRDVAAERAELESHGVQERASNVEIEDAHDFILDLERQSQSGDADSIITLARVRLAKQQRLALGFAGPQPDTAWSREDREFGVRVEVPTLSQFPREKTARLPSKSWSPTFTYLSARDHLSVYTRYLAEVALGVAHAALSYTPEDLVERVIIDVYVDSPNPATGVDQVRTLLSLVLPRGEWSQLVLERVDPLACVKSLSARVSPRPGEMVAVQPLKRVYRDDERFVDHEMIIDALDSRPNLMTLSPTEFESLVQNLFERMGLETRQTRASRDGGVDAVAYDPRPIVGGKIVIQAKRYKNTVGVSAVRDLYGTLQNEGGSKGLLVTTSRFGNASYEFAKNKPLELIDGPELLYLLKEHAGLEARIVPPEDWVDPAPNADGPMD